MNNRSAIDESSLIRHIKLARIRQWSIAATSVLAAAMVVAFLSPDEIGAFSYYTITGLILLNAIFAVRHTILIIYPIESLLRRIYAITCSVENGELGIKHLSISSNDAFSYLSAGIDNLITKLSDIAHSASEKSALNSAMLQTMPFTIFTVSRTGAVLSIVKDQYQLIEPLQLTISKIPSVRVFGESNHRLYLESIKNSFEARQMKWFDMNIGEHHLRCSVDSINKMTAVVVVGDLPTIDKLVANETGLINKNDFTHQQNAMKHFAASIAHDGRNVFTALKNIIEVNRNSSDPQLREQMSMAEDAIVRGTKLMTELMQYAGETRYQLKTLPSAETLRKLHANPTLNAMVPKNITLISTISDEPMADIDIDIDQAWKVVFNFIKNSVEAIGTLPGHIWLHARPYEITTADANTFHHSGTLSPCSGILIAVTDDGPGIDPSLVNAIFDPYTSSKGNGRGLGLATALSVVEAHNGAVRVRSKLGQGTTFEVFIPASRHSQAELDMIREIAPNGEILLVDDDPIILKTTGLILKALKIAAHPSANEFDAFRKLRALRTRLKAVLVDANLGSTTSISLVHKIKTEQPELPIILASGDEEEAVRAKFADAPYDYYLPKPYTIGELTKVFAAIKLTGESA